MSMSEAASSEKTLKYQLKGAQRQQALEGCLARIKAWGLTMPSAEVLVSDWELGEFGDTGLIEFWIANEEDAGYCGKFLFVFDGQTCPFHHHAAKHETFLVLKGQVRMTVDGQARMMKEGDLLTMPPGAEHSFTGVGDALLIEVSMPCMLKDNFFQDKRIGEDGIV